MSEKNRGNNREEHPRPEPASSQQIKSIIDEVGKLVPPGDFSEEHRLCHPDFSEFSIRRNKYPENAVSVKINMMVSPSETHPDIKQIESWMLSEKDGNYEASRITVEAGNKFTTAQTFENLEFQKKVGLTIVSTYDAFEMLSKLKEAKKE